MTDKLKQLAPKILEEISSAKNVLLHCHPGMDGDSVGSTLAMMAYLKSLGKNVLAITGDDLEVPNYLKVLPGTDKIQKKTFGEVDLSKFDLFIIQDTSSPKRITQLTEVKFPENLKTIVIDHHPEEPGFGDINLTEDFRIAACELLTDLFNEWKVDITPDMAIALFLGIYTDSGGFRHRKVSAHTFEVVAQLSDLYPEFTDVIFQMNNSNDPDAMKFQGLFLSNIENYFDDNLAVGEVNFEQIKAKNIDQRFVHSGQLVNLLISVRGWNIGASLIEKEPGLVFLSFRTRDERRFDLSKLAQALGGGGHPAASAARLEMSFEKAKELLLETIPKVYPGIGKA